LLVSCLRYFSAGRCIPRVLHSFPTRRSSDLCIAEFECPGEATSARKVGSPADDTTKAHAASEVDVEGRGRGRHKRKDSSSCEKLDRKSTRLNSSHVKNSYAVFCLKKKKTNDR